MKRRVSVLKGREFPLSRLERISQLERWHFWFRGRRELLRRKLNKYLEDRNLKILDIGSGTGFFLEMLQRMSGQVFGLDLHFEGLKGLCDSTPDSLVLQADAAKIPFRSNTFDVVTMIDVLEHVDDEKVLEEVSRILRPRGLILLTVPAYSWLWSVRDVEAGHLRRYSKTTLSQLLISKGFQISVISFYQFFLFPFLALFRFFGRKNSKARDLEEKPAPFLNRLLTRLNQIEVGLGERISWPWGSSLLAVARKSPL